jgi:nickel transport system ATP-binding protein
MSLLQLKDVTHTYAASNLLWRQKHRTKVLSNVSLTIEQGMCLGLLGMSGAGKSTLGKVILGLEKPLKGQVLFQGHDLYDTDSDTRKQLRRDLQVVFQDYYSSVNPRMTAEQIIGEPLRNYERLSKAELRCKVGELLIQVGLNTDDIRKLPHQFSGGQLQRINIARAIALNPKLIVLDEAVSSLDMVNQTHIIHLLDELKVKLGLSYLFITHDIKAAASISDTFAFMENGEVVYHCDDAAQLLSSQHPSVKALMESMLSDHPIDRSVSAR